VCHELEGKAATKLQVGSQWKWPTANQLLSVVDAKGIATLARALPVGGTLVVWSSGHPDQPRLAERVGKDAKPFRK
jgi:hypothetical protein